MKGDDERASLLESAAIGAAAVGALYLLLSLLLWSVGQVSGWLWLHRWPPSDASDSVWVLWLLGHDPGQPAQAWPAAAHAFIPAAVPYWSAVTVALTVLVMPGFALFQVVSQRRARWAHTNPRRLGYARGNELALPNWSDPGRRTRAKRAWEPSYDTWLGFEPDGLGLRRPLRGAGDRQTSGVVGRPGSGKTLGLILPNLLAWPGSAIVTSTKTDVLRLGGRHRQKLANDVGGEAHLVDWANLVGPDLGMRSLGFDILDGCRDTRVSSNRTEALLGATEAPHGDRTDQRFWKNGAALILRPYLHAAALAESGIGQVLEWLDQQESHEPARIINAANPAAGPWADRLRGLKRSPSQVTIGGYFETAKSVFAALQEPIVLANCQRSELDVERFLETCSTLFLVDPAGEAQLSPTAPLTAALIDWIADRAYARARRLPGQVCEPRLGLLLDELPNIAPLASLGRHLSQGSSQGVNVVFWSSQTFGQLVARFGSQEASTIWSLTRYTMLFGGSKEADWLERLSRLAGEYEDWEESSTRGDRGTTVTRQRVRRPILPIETAARIPWGEAILLADGRPIRVLTPPAPTVRQFARLLGPPRISTTPTGVPEAVGPSDVVDK
jgi:type IV secretion system protein VirD4